MSTVKRKIKTGISKEQGKNVQSMFNEMMGIEDCEVSIIIPKFVSIRNSVRKLCSVLMQFSEFKPLHDDMPELKESLNQIKEYSVKIKTALLCDDTKDKETEEKYKDVSKEEMNKLYKKLKNSNELKELTVLCGRLKSHSLDFIDKDDLKDHFIHKEPGLSLLIFKFSSLDLKKIWVHNNIKPIIKKYILNILHHVYVECYSIYKTSTSADIDIEKFSSVIIDSLNSFKNIPELNRCHNAFKKIEKSVHLLNNNFDVYYRESISSQNPNLIIENFILDVGNQKDDSNPVTITEFRKIVMYLRKLSSQNGKSKDPRVKSMLDILQSRLNMDDKEDKEDKEDCLDNAAENEADDKLVAEADDSTEIGNEIGAVDIKDNGCNIGAKSNDNP